MSEVRDPLWFCPYCYQHCYESERELHIELHGPNPRLDGLQDRLAVLKAERCPCCDDGYDEEACTCLDIQAEQREVEQEIALLAGERDGSP